MRGDDHSPLRAIGPVVGRGSQNRGHQVGKTLAHARAGFGHQVMPLADGLGHGFGHGQLLGALFVVLEPGGDAPVWPQDFRR